MNENLKLYHQLAEWWPLLSKPEDYEEESSIFAGLINQYGNQPKTMLELGSGGGNSASFLKKSFQMTLSDCAEAMLKVSEKLNPDCSHFLGDMRYLRLEKQFDAIFIHDAISYITSKEDLQKTMETAFLHCRPGGVVLLAPDKVKENFSGSTNHGGHDGNGKALRYLEWTFDPDPTDDLYVTDYAYLLKTGNKVEMEQDHHILGLFSRQTWLELLEQNGFEAHLVSFPHSELPPNSYEGFIGVRPK